MKKYTLFTLFFLSFWLNLSAQNNLTTRTVATGLDTPWEIIWGPDNHIWVTERFGRISRINPTTGQIIPLITIADVRENGEGGLLGMALDTIVRNNLSDVYVAYNYQNANNVYREKIVKYQYNGTSLINPTIIFDNINAATTHNGCRLLISPDRKLLFTTGDAATTSNSQTLSSLNGKILRLNLDGSIPADNPIGNNPAWSWGHRNAQGLIYVPQYNTIYSSEHGQNLEDELNIIQKSRNYGWPQVEGICNVTSETAFCRDSNVIEPIAIWSPPLGVAGIDFYNHNRIPEWKNSILMASLRGSRLTVNKLSNDGKQVLSKTDFYTNTYGRLRDVCVSPDGKVYIAVSNKDTRGTPRSDDDKIVEISAPSTPVIEVTPSVSIFPNPVHDILTIDIKQAIGRVELMDNTGKLILSTIGENTLNIAHLPDGLYLLTIYAFDNTVLYSGKVVKAR
jgi:aldose sugar dehydrogenase